MRPGCRACIGWLLWNAVIPQGMPRRYVSMDGKNGAVRMKVAQIYPRFSFVRHRESDCNAGSDDRNVLRVPTVACQIVYQRTVVPAPRLMDSHLSRSMPKEQSTRYLWIVFLPKKLGILILVQDEVPLYHAPCLNRHSGRHQYQPGVRLPENQGRTRSPVAYLISNGKHNFHQRQLDSRREYYHCSSFTVGSQGQG